MKHCDACNRSMTYTNKEGREVDIIGLHLSIVVSDDTGFIEEGFRNIYPEVKKKEYRVCYVCLLKSYGVKLQIVLANETTRHNQRPNH